MEQASRRRKPYYELTSAMVKTGILGYGGGPSVIPLIRYEAVNHYGWMEDEEFGEILALANALPGPIATKIAAYLGYRQKGTPGAVVAVIAHILPSSLAMIALLSVVGYLSSSAVVQGMIAAVVPVVAVMIGLMAYEFAERAVKGLGKPAGFGFFALSLLMLEIIQIHAAIVIIVFLAYGAFHFKAVRWLRGRLGKRGTPDDGKEDGS
ncbi:chromate transporter [Paenibacillus chitinolyticus]|uniref:chromate transporter n=1 Tax=Paenibacillus chitinolyticus TaxID=79263 RepID=UPI0036D84C2C